MSKSLKQASATAKNKYNKNAAFLSNLGESKTSFAVVDALDAIEFAIGNFIAKVQENINQAVGKTGDPLINTGDITNISAEKTESGWIIKSSPHLDFQSKGVSGTERIINSPYRFSGKSKSVNVDAVKTWIRQRNIQFEGVSEDSTAFLIARSIYKNGIDPKNLWEAEAIELADEAGKDIADAIANSIQNNTKIEKNIKI